MLEDLAWRFSELDDTYYALIIFGLFYCGGLVGGLTNRSLAEIQRAPYFALSGLIYLTSAVVCFVGSIFVVQAIVQGYFWTVIALDFVVTLVGGFYVARLSVARSRDAHGHGRFAFLGLVPIANFWLFFKPSRSETSDSRKTFVPALTAQLGAVTGAFLFYAAHVVTSLVETERTHRIEKASAAGVFEEAFLDENLQSIASQISVPQELDETTTLVRVGARSRIEIHLRRRSAN